MVISRLDNWSVRFYVNQWTLISSHKFLGTTVNSNVTKALGQKVRGRHHPAPPVFDNTICPISLLDQQVLRYHSAAGYNQ
jgi:hypothetical protein